MTKGLHALPAQRGSQSGLGSFPGGPSGELLTSGRPPHMLSMESSQEGVLGAVITGKGSALHPTGALLTGSEWMWQQPPILVREWEHGEEVC